MIKEIYNKPPKKYGNFFLCSEAPDEEPSEIKPNTKVIDVKPSKRRLDFTDGADIPDEEPEGDSEENLNGEPPTEDLDNTEPETEELDNREDQGGTEEENLDNTDEPDVDDNTDFTSDSGTEEIDQDIANTNAEIDANNQTPDTTDLDNSGDETGIDDGPDVDDNTDFTSDDGTDTQPTDGSGGEEATPQDQPGEERKGPGLEYDSTRKYNLFREFMSLVNAIDNFISKLENKISDDMAENQVIKTSTDKLREVRELCSDYMTMKFEAASYVQSLIFYQSLIAMIQLVFDLLSKMKKKIKK